MSIILPATQPLPLPDQDFVLRLKIDTSQCVSKPPQVTLDWQTSGLELNFAEVLTHGTLYFQSRRVRKRRGETAGDARRRKVGEILEDWEPRVAARKSKPARLVVRKPLQGHGESTSDLSELLGEAITLSVAIRAFDVPFRRWKKRSYVRGRRHDFDAAGRAGRVYAEARGRFEPKSITEAVVGIQDKFDELSREKRLQRRYSRMLGVVYALRTSADDRKYKLPDVTLVDPDDSGVPAEEVERWRDLLRHYAAFFAYQGKNTVAEELRKLARGTKRALILAVSSQTGILPVPPLRRPGGDLWGRTTLLVEGEPYIGTMWTRDILPLGPTPGAPSERRPVFWGISWKVANALSQCAVDTLDSMQAHRWCGRLGHFGYSAMDDGTVVVYELGGKSLVEHP